MSESLPKRPAPLRGASDLDWERLERNFRHYDDLFQDLAQQITDLKAAVEALQSAGGA